MPPEQGGLAYLGRVRLDPVADGRNVTVVADHWMKWAFHFLVEADPQSPSFKLPLRLYGSLGVRQVFHGWSVGEQKTKHTSRSASSGYRRRLGDQKTKHSSRWAGSGHPSR